MILKKTKEGWYGEFQGFFAFQPVPADFKSTRQKQPDAMHQVAFDVKQTYLRSIAAPGKRCMRYGLEYILIEVYDHYLVSKGPLQAFDTLDWIEGSEW